MKRLIVVRPVPITLIQLAGGFPSFANLLTPNPKEIEVSNSVANGTLSGFLIDMGAVVSLDTFFFGFTNSPAVTSSLNIYTDNAAYTAPVLQATSPLIESTLVSPIRHGFARLAAPVASRYWRAVMYNATGGNFIFTVAVLAVGLALEVSLGQEMGAGRMVEDTSTVERLVGGAFGINEGAILGGYDWTFGDLSDAERDSLYALVRSVGSSRSLLVVEDPDQTAGLAERIHWGLFDRLEKYERQAFNLTKWSLRIKDWG